MIMASPQMVEPIEMTPTPGRADFAGLYERHYEAVFHAALRVTGRPADAEDVLQTVFLRVLRGEHGAAARTAVGLLSRAAVNAAVDLLRRRAMRGETAYDDAAPHAAVEPALLLKEQLRRAIADPQSRGRDHVRAALRRGTFQSGAGRRIPAREEQRRCPASSDPDAGADGTGTLGEGDRQCQTTDSNKPYGR